VSRRHPTFEGNVPYELRFMIDAQINGCDWIRVPAGAYDTVEAEPRPRVTATGPAGLPHRCEVHYGQKFVPAAERNCALCRSDTGHLADYGTVCDNDNCSACHEASPRLSVAQYELTVRDHREVHGIPSATKGDVAPMRYLSYDIEVLNTGTGFPTPDRCPAITICCALQVMGGKGIVHQVRTIPPDLCR